MSRVLERRMVPATILVGLAVAVIVGCGGSSSGGGTVDAQGVKDAKSAVAKYEPIPTFALKAPAFDAQKAIQGKTVFNIPSFSGIPFYDVGDAEMQRITEALGGHWIEYPNQGTPQEWGKGIEQAIAQHADIISLGGTDPNLNIPQLQDAKRAGIPVVETQIYNTGEPVPGKANSLITAQRTARFNDAARLEVDWAVAQSNGNAQMLVSTSNEQPPNLGIVGAMQDEMKNVCPTNCSMVVDNVPLTDWATKITPATQSSLVKHPDTNWAIPVYDAQTNYMVAGLRQAGKIGKVKIATYNGSGDVLRQIQQDKGDPVNMDVGENLYWNAWANMDTVLRVLAKVAPVPKGDEKTPLRIFSIKNVDEAGTPAVDGKGYGTAYVGGYNKLWQSNIPTNPGAK